MQGLELLSPCKQNHHAVAKTYTQNLTVNPSTLAEISGTEDLLREERVRSPKNLTKKNAELDGLKMNANFDENERFNYNNGEQQLSKRLTTNNA